MNGIKIPPSIVCQPLSCNFRSATIHVINFFLPFMSPDFFKIRHGLVESKDS
jgi:hypothetical protein